ncbi:MAG: DUF3267 domain-containing protein [Micromonosporaceae bacterium]
MLAIAAYLMIWGLAPIGSALTWASRSVTHALIASASSLALFALGTVTHELIHALVFCAVARNGVRAVRFGFEVLGFVFYTHLLQAVHARGYRFAIAMPGLLLRALPCVLGLATGNLPTMLFGALFLAAAGGDLVILWLLRGVPSTAMVEDHPSRVGCYVLRQPPRQNYLALAPLRPCARFSRSVCLIQRSWIWTERLGTGSPVISAAVRMA